jgi:hypothetical protein
LSRVLDGTQHQRKIFGGSKLPSDALTKTQFRVNRLTFFLITLFIFFLALLASGLEIYPSLKCILLIFGFSAPMYLILSRTKFMAISLTLALFLSLVTTTICGSLLFGFSTISSFSGLLPIMTILAVLLFAFIIITERRSGNSRGISSQEKYGITTVGLFLIPASWILNRSYPISESNSYWLPDDFPFFAVLAKDMSNGLTSETFFSGVSINYHWLTYSFFGGINRLIGIDQLQGLVVIPPVLGCLILCLGGVAVVKMLTNLRLAAVLSVLAILFANSVGLASYATSSLGGTVVSPSTLLTSSWFLATVLITHLLIKMEMVRIWQFPLIFILGFSLALGKISTAAISVIGIMLLITFNYIKFRPTYSWHPAGLIKATFVLVFPFLLGIGMVRVLFLSTSETPLGVDGSLHAIQNGNLTLWIVTLLPIFASVFSFSVLVAPTILDYSRATRNDLVFASASLSVLGLAVIFVFDFGAENEAWFLLASLSLILPTSAVAVCQLLSDHLSSHRVRRILQITTVAGATLACALGTLLLSDNPLLEVRPWLLPTILVAIFLIIGSFYAVLGDLFSRVPAVMTTLRLAFAGIFLLSTVFGMLLRTESLIGSGTQGRQGVSELRDEWLSKSKSLVESIERPRDNAPVAIYSDSAAETTLTRWIPYFLDSHAYNLNPEDSITDYFTPTNVLAQRQSVVKDFVEEKNLEACQTLESDGVHWVWVTQGLDLVNTSRVTSSSPVLIKVDCSHLKSQQ